MYIPTVIPNFKSMKYPTIRVVFDRKHQATKQKAALVQVEILFERKRKYISTGVKVFAGQWKDKTMVTGRMDAMDLNERISLIMANIREFINKLIKEKKPFSFHEFQKIVDSKSLECNSFLDFVRERIELRQVRETTKRQHRAMLRRLTEFGIIKSFEDLTVKNINLLDDYERKFTSMQTTVYDFHKRVRFYVKEAMQLDLIDKNPYDKFEVKRGKYRVRKPLTNDELMKITDCNIPDQSISNVRDCFMFCRWTGLAYVDLLKFDFKNVENLNGSYYISDTRTKTDTPYKLMLLSPAIEILKKHNYVLPTMTNQQFNLRLKVLASYAGINRKLTSHLARHTFATWVLSQGIPIETLSKMLGHSDIKTTQIYAKVLQEDVTKGFGKLEKRILANLEKVV